MKNRFQTRFGCRAFFAALLIDVVGLTLSPAPASAQNGYDFYSVPRTISITPPKLFTGATIWSNSPVDIRGGTGIGKVDIGILTNGAAGSLVLTLYGSSDLTNWTVLPSCSIVSNTTAIAWTNTYYPAAIQTTNTYLLPGVVTTPTAATAGFASKYLLPYPFTNSATISCAQGGTFEIGFNATDAPRYLSLQYAGAATGTNFVFSVLTFRDSQYYGF